MQRRILAMAVILALVVASLGALVATETTLTVTNVRPLGSGLASERRPSIHGNMVAFLGSNNVTSVYSDIYVANLETNALTRITHNGTIAASPDLSGEYVVWSWYDGNRSRPFVSDITSPSPRELPHDAVNIQRVRIDGDRVVWTEDQPLAGSRFLGNTISLHNLTTGQSERLVFEDAAHGNLAPHGDRLVWGAIHRTSWEYYPPPEDLYMMNLTTRVIMQLTDDGFSRSASVFGDLVVYTRYELARGFELMLYDATSRQTRPLTINQHTDFGGVVFGHRIAWLASPDIGNQVFLTDLDLGKTITVTNRTRSAGSIALSARFLVWEDSDLMASGVRVMVGEVVVQHFALWPVSLVLAASAAVGATVFIWRSRNRLGDLAGRA